MALMDHYSQLLGVEYLHCGFDSASCRLAVRGEHLNALGSLHGGVIFSLADIAFAAACNAAGAAYVGMQAEIRYMRRPEGKALLARAELVGNSRRMAHYQVSVTDSAGHRVALFTGSAYRLAA